MQSLIPPKEESDDYIERTIWGMWDTDILIYAGRERHNVILQGPTGSAKTTFVKAYAAKYQLPFYSIPCNGAIEPTQLFGKWVPTENIGELVWQDGPVTQMVRRGGVVLVDEVNFAPPAFLAVLHSLLDRRRQLTLLEHDGEVINAHPKFQIVAAYNPRYKGTRPLNEAFLNRFALKLPFGYLREVEAELVKVAPALIDIAEKLRRQYDAGELVTPISTNMLMEFEDFGQDLGYRWASENFIAAFHYEEQDAVRNVLELHQDELLEQFETVDTTPNYDNEFGEVGK